MSHATSSPPGAHPSFFESFWRALIHFDSSHVNFAVALRNALGIALPLAAGVAWGNIAAGDGAAIGALNVAAGDDLGPYRKRARRMLTSTVVVSIAVLIGSLAGRNAAAAFVVTVLWAFAAGLIVALGQAAADVATMSLVIIIIYTAQSSTVPEALFAGLAALGGGLLQTALSVALWPIRRLGPDRRLIGDFYREISRAAIAPANPNAPPLATLQSMNVRDALPTGDARHAEAKRHFLLVRQAERIRLSIAALRGSRARLAGKKQCEAAATAIDRFLELASLTLASVSESLYGSKPPASRTEWPAEIDRLLAASRDISECLLEDASHAQVVEAIPRMEALAGQLRVALELADPSIPLSHHEAHHEDKALQRQREIPWARQMDGWMAALRASLSLDSSACRHAIRLALCVLAGEVITHTFLLQRSYWLAMTVALVLRPDFGSTFSRGVLRLVGTYAGLLLASVLVHQSTAPASAHVLWIGLLAFIMFWWGRANYGLFVTALSALIVFLFSLTGIAPNEVIAARALNTTIGGALALAIYLIWPTRERTQAPQALASMLDAYRLYVQAVSRLYLDRASTPPHDMDRIRLSGRRARANAETSVERMSAEPGVDPAQLSAVNGVVSRSHRFIHTVMALESGGPLPLGPSARDAYQAFSFDLEKTLYFLAARFRGSALTPDTLPNLAESRRRLVDAFDPADAPYALLALETDDIATTLALLADQVFRWAAIGPNTAAPSKK